MPLPVKMHISEPTFSKRAFRPHKHKEFEIGLFKSGSGVYKTVDKVYDIKSGDVFIFSTDEVHCVTDITAPMVTMNIKIEPRLMWGNSDGLFGAKYLSIFLNPDPKFGNRLNRDNEHIGEVRSLLLTMEEEFCRPDGEDMLRACLLELFVKLSRYFAPPSGDGHYIKKENFLPVERAMNFIDDHFTEPLALNDVAARANMSPNYFCSVFKKLNGLSTWDYITLKRIEKAKQLLRSQNGATMLSVAEECGFSSTAGFNKAFRHCTGFTPTDFKKFM